jgi:hypothetical protein
MMQGYSQSFGVHHDMYARFVVPVQMYKRVPLEKICICSIYDARNRTTCTTDVAVPKSLVQVLLLGVDMPHANAQKSS